MAALTTKGKIRDFTEGPLLSRIIFFSLPLIATSVLHLLFNTADTIVVGRWGGATPDECESALAAVGSCSSLINLIVTLFMGLSLGSGICVAQSIGAKRYDRLEKIVHTSVLTAIILGTIASVFGFFMARPLLILMGTEEKVLDQAVPYMKAYFVGILANMIYNYCAAMIRSTGDTLRPLFFLTIAGVANVGLNLVMVLAFHQGALGVGVATAASNWVACILIIAHMMRKDCPCHLTFKKLSIDFGILKKIIRIGIPAGLTSALFSISNVTIQSSINSLGKITVAGNAASANLEGYIYVTQNSLYQATLTFVGQNAGARRADRIKRIAGWSLLCVTVIGIAVSSLMLLFGRQLIGLYAPDNQAVIDKGMTRMYIVGATHAICGLMEVGCGCIRGMGKSFGPMIVSLMGSCVFRVVWVFTIFQLVPESIKQQTLYYSYPLSWILTGAVHFLCFFIVLRKAKKSWEARTSALPAV